MAPSFPVLNSPFGTASLAVAAVLGLLSLFFGRQLFYVFVALVGFVIGFGLGRALLGAPSNPAHIPAASGGWLPLIIGIILGVLVALLAVFLQRPIAALSAFAVFFAAGRQIFAGMPGSSSLVPAVILGLIALVLVWIFFDWGLIVSSAVIGAAVLTTVISAFVTLPGFLALLVFAVLFVLGFVFQARNLGGKAP
jgi:hypothetical protein